MTRPSRGTRRRAIIAAAILLMSCADNSAPPPPDSATIARITITAQPSAPTFAPVTGWTTLGLGTSRDGRMYVPASYNPGTPTALLVLLHGAGSSSEFWQTDAMKTMADANNLVLLATDSRESTWDMPENGSYDADVAFLNAALLHVFARVNVAPTQIALAGFSDGASEAFGLGIANAALFRHIMAFSPGLLYVPISRGNPEIFVAHGTEDNTFLNTQNNIVPVLRSQGMTVTFVAFTGGHVLTQGVVNESVSWWLNP